MRFSTKLQSILAAVLFVSVVGKAASNREAPPPDPNLFASQLESALSAAGLKISGRSHSDGAITIVAQGRRCKLWATEYTPYGTMADVISDQARSVGQLQYVYVGRVYDNPPKIAPLIAFYWWRELKRVGISQPRFPIVAVAAAPSCRIRVPWTQMSALAR